MWNYRVVKDEYGFSFREVFYDEAGEPDMWVDEPCHAFGETEEEFSEDLKLMAQALERPFLKVVGKKHLKLKEIVN